MVKNGTTLSALAEGYGLCARGEGKSHKTIEIVTRSVSYLERFLESAGMPTDVTSIGPGEIRAFALYLQRKPCFSDHPFTRGQQRGLSGHTVSCYLRSIRAFWSWLAGEGIVDESPFSRVKVPRAPRKVVPTFSDSQIRALLDAIDTDTPEGFRDYAVILMLLDTGLRISELINLRLGDVRLEERVLKVMGKGNKERLVPFGRGVQRLLWRYTSCIRPEPALVKLDFVFVTWDGRPLTKNRVDARMKKYGRKAGLGGVRCSPHTLRHTAAVSFLRNGGDAFSLQRLLGHTTLEMTRHYCELADVDVQRAHAAASPVDNLVPVPPSGRVGAHSRGRKAPALAGRR